ncbi:hypothetical protein Ahy_A01g004501 [Arachis hypogaea]|uniref:Transposase MuDR plant domain-containing protein n=1 Tax=Arachis hypogaea TaxID=3818 RepID=A0A445EW86_ARAHY|nr:hypothetical protein Ahy_A01g004501 [Arachis hypogaea]
MTFECQDPILFRTQCVETMSNLKSLILSKFRGTQAREIGRVAYRLLAPMGNRIFRFRLFRLHGDEHVRLIFDIHGRIMCEQVMELAAEVGHGGRPPLAPPPIHVAIPENEVEEGEEESDEDYVADSGDSESSDGGDEDKFVPETPAGAVPRLGMATGPHGGGDMPPAPRPRLHYSSPLDLDAMHERIPVSDICGVDYNLDGIVEFRVGYKFRSREVVLQGVKNYSIRRSAEYRVIESDRVVKPTVDVNEASVWPFVRILDTGRFGDLVDHTAIWHPPCLKTISDIAHDSVQPVCQYPSLARCGPHKLSLQTLIQKCVDDEAEGVNYRI